MKKTLLSLAVMAMMAASLSTLTACGDDNTPEPGTKPADRPSLTAMDIIMTANPTDDMWAYMNLYITTTVDSTKTETFVVDPNNLTDTLTIPASALPAIVKVEYKCSKKEGATADPAQKIRFNFALAFTFNTIKSDGTRSECIALGVHINKKEGIATGEQLETTFQRVTLETCNIRIEENGQPYWF